MNRGRTVLLSSGASEVTTSVAAGGTTNQITKFTGPFKIGDSSLADTGTDITSTANLLFSPDNTLDIGAQAATRPRTVYTGTALTTSGAVIIGAAPALTGDLRFGANAAIEGVTSLVINESGADLNLIIESDTNANHFVSDAGAYGGVGSVAFGGSASGTPLAVAAPAITITANDNFYRLRVADNGPVTNPAGSTAAIIASVRIDEPNITQSGIAVSDAYSLYIDSAPTEGTRNGAVWVASGASRFDGAIYGGSAIEGFASGTTSNNVLTLGSPDKGMKQIYAAYEDRSGGVTGATTINRIMGSVNIAAGQSAIVVTNSLVTTSTKVFAVVQTNDATATIKNVVPTAGSFTVTITAAATAETRVGWFLFNAN